jgi:hypothetical protein
MGSAGLAASAPRATGRAESPGRSGERSPDCCFCSPGQSAGVRLICLFAAYSLRNHCVFTAYHCLFTRAYSLMSIHSSIHCIFTAYVRHCRGHRVALVVTHATKDVAYVFRKLIGDEVNPGFLQSTFQLFKASPKRRDELQQCCLYYDVPWTAPPRARTTRWNSILTAANTDGKIAVPLFAWAAAHAEADSGAHGQLSSMRHVYWFFGLAMVQDVLPPLLIVSKVIHPPLLDSPSLLFLSSPGLPPTPTPQPLPPPFHLLLFKFCLLHLASGFADS